MFLSGMHMKSFVPVTAQELVFGYDDPLVSIAHRFFPKTRRPMSQMGLLLGVMHGGKTIVTCGEIYKSSQRILTSFL